MSTFFIILLEIYYFIGDVGRWDYFSYFLSICSMVRVRTQGLGQAWFTVWCPYMSIASKFTFMP